MTNQSADKSFFQNLWDRRVPQYFATYLGIAWAVTQALDFASKRYDLPSSIVDKFLLFAIIMLPAFLIFTYNHGRPGKDKWLSYEKVLIPLNLLLAIGLATIVSPGNYVKASTPSEIEVTNEEGETIKRLIPSVNQTKSFSIFPFKNKGKEDDAWLKFALPNLFEKDLEQDMRIWCLSAISYKYELEKSNHSIDDNNIQLKTFLKIAKDDITNFLVTGEYEVLDDGQIDLTIQVHETATGELFYEKNIVTEDKIGVIDVFTKELYELLYLKESNESSSELRTDLPAGNLISENETALKNYTEANLLFRNGKYDEGKIKLNKALELEPNVPSFLSLQATSDYNSGFPDKAVEKLELAIRNAEDLPERQKFRLKQNYYTYGSEFDKYLKLGEYWRQLYPRDYTPYSELINYYKLTRNMGQAREVALSAVVNGHGARVLKDLAEIAINRKEYDDAEKYIEEYYRLFPDKKKEEDKLLPIIYRNQGQFDKSISLYESMLLNNPSNHELISELGDLYSYKGDKEMALKTYEKAIKKATVAQDSLIMYFKLMGHYASSGQVKEFVKVRNDQMDLSQRNGGRVSALFSQMGLIGFYALAGQKDLVEEMNQEVAQLVPGNAAIFDCVSRYLYALIQDDRETFNKYNSDESCRQIIITSTPHFNYLMDSFEAKFEKDYSAQIKHLNTYIDSTQQASDDYSSMLVEAYRLNGEAKKALEICQEMLKLRPGETQLNFELTKTHMDLGHMEEAKKAFEVVQDHWSKSEPEFILYDKFKEVEKQLSAI